jgi:hypothetical protein
MLIKTKDMSSEDILKNSIRIGKTCTIKCNGDFLRILTITGGFLDHKYDPVYLNIEENCKIFGDAIAIVLDRCNMHFPHNLENYFDHYSREPQAQRHKDFIKDMMKKFRYKTKGKAFENMMSVSVSKNKNGEKKIKITPWIHVKMDHWNEFGKDERRDIFLSSDAPTEILGAAVRFAFTLCEGQGADIVVKALFPYGAPNSLDKYLASVDSDYKKYIFANFEEGAVERNS